MNRFKSLIFVLSTCVCVVNVGGVTDASYWPEDIQTRKMFVRRKVTSIAELVQNDPELEDVDSFIAKNLHVMYATLKCKYADHVVDVLQTFYEVISFSLYRLSESQDSDQSRITLVKTVIDSFYNTKPLFAKIVYNLFTYFPNSPELRTSEQHFLKTVLSVNLFLYHGRKKNRFIVLQESTSENSAASSHETLHAARALNNTIVHAIGLVERFRLKNCFVEDSYKKQMEFRTDLLTKYYLRDIDIITSILNEKTRCLESALTHNTPVTPTKYHDEMYDPESLLLHRLLNFENSIIARAKSKFIADSEDMNLEQFYETAVLSHDIESVLKYQNCLLEIVSSVFARQIDDMLSTDLAETNNNRGRIEKLKLMRTALNTFVDSVLPNNCTTNVCDFIVSFRRSFDTHVVSFERGTVLTTVEIEGLKNELRAFYEGTYWHTEDDLSAVHSLPVGRLLSHICRHFQPFRQVIVLLSCESNTNRSHRLEHNASSRDVGDVSADEGGQEANTMFQLRFVLFSLRTVCASTDPGSEKNDFKLAFLHATQAAIDAYDGAQHDRDCANVLLPLLIHLRHVDDSFDRLDGFDLKRLEHALLFAIVAVENYLWLEHKCSVHNAAAYVKCGSDPTASFNFLAQTVATSAGRDVDSVSVGRFLNGLYDREFHHERLKIEGSDKEILFYWNGAETRACDIFDGVPRDVNDAQDLIRYKWLVVKWFLARLFLRMKFVLMCYRDLETRDTPSAEDIRLKLISIGINFDKIFLPDTVKLYLHTTFQLFNTAIIEDISSFHEGFIDLSLSAVNQCIVSLGVATDQQSYESIENIVQFLNDFFVQFNIMTDLLKDDYILYTEDAGFTTVIYPMN